MNCIVSEKLVVSWAHRNAIFYPKLVYHRRTDTLQLDDVSSLEELALFPFTTCSAKANPLIRYRTGDITVLREAPCSCGHTSARIAPILRRTDHRLSIRGIPLYPEQVEALLRGIDPALDDFRLIVTTQYGIGEQLELQLVRSATQDFPGGNRSHYLDLLRSHIRRVLVPGARIQLVAPEHLPQEGLTYQTVFK